MSRRRFLSLAGGGLALAVGACGLSALVEPGRGYWRRLRNSASRRIALNSPPPAPVVEGRSTIFHVSDVPQSDWSPANAPAADWQATHVGVDALLDLMSENGLKLHRSQTSSPHGSPQGLISSHDVVLIKINAQWEERGMTNTDVVRGLIRRILDHPDGFSGEVVIVENGQMSKHHLAEPATNNDEFADHSQSYQGIVDLFASQGYRVSLYNWSALRAQVPDWDEGDNHQGYVAAGPYPLNYPKFVTSHGTHISLHRGIWDGSDYAVGRLKFINMPVLKSHLWFGVTASVKNFLGVMSKHVGAEEAGVDPYAFSFHAALTEEFNGLAPGLPGSLMALRYPTLNVLDAIYVSPRGNRTQDATYQATPRQGALLASLDPIALDYYASKYVLLPVQNAVGVSSQQIENANPELGSVCRCYLLAAQARLLEGGHVVRFGDEGLNVVRRALT